MPDSLHAQDADLAAMPAATENAVAFNPGADDVFARVAGRYDRLCDIFSLFIHRIWKSRMAARIASHPAGTILDVGSGTGHIPLRVKRALANRNGAAPEKFMVTDLCPEMLAIARRKLGDRDPWLDYAIMDAHRLGDVETDSIDLYSISFAMKICDRGPVLREAMRVLKPGGMFFCLEAARIPNDFLHGAYLKYMDWCLPVIGRLAAGGDPSAYGYLLHGIHDFPRQTRFADEIASHGFEEVSFENMTFGIVALHTARKPDRTQTVQPRTEI